MKLKGGFQEDGAQKVGVHKESQNLFYLLGRLKLGTNIPKILLKNTFLMQNKKIAAQLAMPPLRSIPSSTSGQIRKWHQRWHLKD